MLGSGFDTQGFTLRSAGSSGCAGEVVLALFFLRGTQHPRDTGYGVATSQSVGMWSNHFAYFVL